MPTWYSADAWACSCDAAVATGALLLCGALALLALDAAAGRCSGAFSGALSGEQAVSDNNASVKMLIFFMVLLMFLFWFLEWKRRIICGIGTHHNHQAQCTFSGSLKFVFYNVRLILFSGSLNR